jgi:hypothetical protein
MKLTSLRSCTAALALLLSSALVACGTQDAHQGMVADEAGIAEDSEAQTFARGPRSTDEDFDSDDATDSDDSDDSDADSQGDDSCETLRRQLKEDLQDMQATEEFESLAQTAQYKALVKTLRTMERKHCKMQGLAKKPSAACNKLRLQLRKEQMGLLRCPEFRALAQTPQFRAVIKSSRAAMAKGCLNGARHMGFVFVTLLED